MNIKDLEDLMRYAVKAPLKPQIETPETISFPPAIERYIVESAAAMFGGKLKV